MLVGSCGSFPGSKRAARSRICQKQVQVRQPPCGKALQRMGEWTQNQEVWQAFGSEKTGGQKCRNVQSLLPSQEQKQVHVSYVPFGKKQKVTHKQQLWVVFGLSQLSVLWVSSHDSSLTLVHLLGLCSSSLRNYYSKHQSITGNN